MKEIEPYLSQFDIDGKLNDIQPLDKGHIHNTYIGFWELSSGEVVRYIHQQFNTTVFADVELVMSNLKRVIDQLKVASTKTNRLKYFDLIPLKNGDDFVVTEQGEIWRTFTFIEGGVSYDSPPSLSIAKEAGRGCGLFIKALADLPPSKMHTPLPNFHDAIVRYDALQEAIKADRSGRVGQASKAIDQALAFKSSATVLTRAFRSGTLTERVAHNDTKLNNILFSQLTGEVMALVDLDTCMPGSALFDFGDLIRTLAPVKGEDTLSMDNPSIDKEMLRAGSEGFLHETRELLNDVELELIGMAPAAITLIVGVRFLTDFLNGDKYFKVSREDQNLNRALAQFAIGKELIESCQVVEKIVDDLK